VVYPGCLSTGSCGNWTLDCTDWQCYGVPIFRQFLNAGETTGVAQGIKMLGASTGQRSTMIANQGTYYIDTAMSLSRQEATGRTHLNTFYANQNYDFFLLYAKPTTNVTYQLYVGESPEVSFDPDTAVSMIRVGTNRSQSDPNCDNATVLVLPLGIDNQTPWPDGWSKNYDSGSGILTVTMNLAGFADDFEQARAESCGPPSFCQWNAAAGECRCAGQDLNFGPIGFACDNSSNVCSWSSLRSECPSGGCFGFRVTFPAGFVADDDNASDSSNPIHRPAPTAFPVSWNVKWQKAPYPLAFDASVPWDQDFYPPPGPCDYNDNATYPKNAPLPSLN
jgi:hypothetical protein